MRKFLFGVLSVVLLAAMWAPLTAFAEDAEPVVAEPGEVLNGTIAVGTAARTDPSLMGEESEKAKACIERRKQKHAIDGPHSWVPPLPGGEYSVPDELMVPHNAPSPPISPAKAGVSPLTLFKNTDILDNSNISGGNLGNVPEPTAVMLGDRVFFSANWAAGVSTNGGETFTYVNPYSGPFADPHPQEDFCCDQTSAFDPATNTIFWLQQYINVVNNTTGTQRINVDRGADGTWDCYYDITAQDMGFETGRWLDFPDLAVSSNYLWHSSNAFTSSNTYDGAFAARYPLSEITSCAPTLNFNSRQTVYFSLRFARGMTTTAYFGSHQSQTQIRVWEWADASPIPIQRVMTTGVWSTGSQGAWTCPGPDNRDWCGRIDSRMQSAYIADGVLGFMWMPRQGGSFPFPYTRVARYDVATWAHIDDIDIWSPDMAYVYPAVAVNSQGDLGGTIMWGGGDTYYNNCSVFIADDVNGGALVPLEHEISVQGNYGPIMDESGDYTMTRVAYPDDTNFVGVCFANEILLRGEPYFVHFGREVVVEPHIFSDGFESGDTTVWSSATP